jgi:hypothetical protein
MKRRRTLQDLYDLMGPEHTAKAKALAEKKIKAIRLRETRKRLSVVSKNRRSQLGSEI